MPESIILRSTALTIGETGLLSIAPRAPFNISQENIDVAKCQTDLCLFALLFPVSWFLELGLNHPSPIYRELAVPFFQKRTQVSACSLNFFRPDLAYKSQGQELHEAKRTPSTLPLAKQNRTE